MATIFNLKTLSGCIAGTGIASYFMGLPSRQPNPTAPSPSGNDSKLPGSPNNNGLINVSYELNPSEYFKIGGFPGPLFDISQHNEFITCYDRERKIPKWVVEHITRSQLQLKMGDRKNSNFKEDQSVPLKYRSFLKDYFRSGYDRGHMAPAANNKHGQNNMDDTFLLTNMAPQVGDGFNRDYWAHLENFCRDLALKDFESIRIVTGPLFLPKLNKETGKFEVKYEVIGNPPNIAVPTHFYKIILAEKPTSFRAGSVDDVYVAAFVLPNDKISNAVPLTDFQTPVDAIERSSGLSLLSNTNNTKKIKDLCSSVQCKMVIREFNKNVKSLPGK
ncbi:hypothetical protein QEN19_002885 [Hanseniaspora menglaensis]